MQYRSLTRPSALLLINAPLLDGASPIQLTPDERQVSKQIVISELEKTRIIAEEYMQGERGTTNDTCPLLLNWLYRSAAASMFLGQETNEPKYHHQTLSVQDSIRSIGQRWRLAGRYFPGYVKHGILGHRPGKFGTG